MWYRSYLKRLVDLSITVPALFLAAPVLLLTGCWILATLGRPILFRQRRPGINGSPFWIHKFRTMSDQRDRAGNLLPDGARLTKFGKWLRSSSLDELPELWNVLIGEMSLVGPRPLLEEYMSRYSPEQARRHVLRPGLTGWAQINGRNAVDWETRLRMDVWYVDNLGFWLDVSILGKTIIKVLSRKDITADGHETCPEFVGEDTKKAA